MTKYIFDKSNVNTKNVNNTQEQTDHDTISNEENSDSHVYTWYKTMIKLKDDKIIKYEFSGSPPTELSNISLEDIKQINISKKIWDFRFYFGLICLIAGLCWIIFDLFHFRKINDLISLNDVFCGYVPFFIGLLLSILFRKRIKKLLLIGDKDSLIEKIILSYVDIDNLIIYFKDKGYIR